MKPIYYLLFCVAFLSSCSKESGSEPTTKIVEYIIKNGHEDGRASIAVINSKGDRITQLLEHGAEIYYKEEVDREFSPYFNYSSSTKLDDDFVMEVKIDGKRYTHVNHWSVNGDRFIYRIEF